MTAHEFDQELRRLTEEFKGLVFSPGKSTMIWAMCSDLPREAMASVVNHFIASFRYPPLVKDFAEALQAERKRHPAPRAENGPRSVDCLSCRDLGYVSVRHAANAFLAKCSCSYGLAQRANLPTVEQIPDPKVASPLPDDAFDPKVPKRDEPRDEDESRMFERVANNRVQERMKWWRAKLEMAEQIWAQWESERHT